MIPHIIFHKMIQIIFLPNHWQIKSNANTSCHSQPPVASIIWDKGKNGNNYDLKKGQSLLTLSGLSRMVFQQEIQHDGFIR